MKSTPGRVTARDIAIVTCGALLLVGLFCVGLGLATIEDFWQIITAPFRAIFGG